MRPRLLLLLLLLCTATTASAQVSISINFSTYPELVRVPDYPVYYAPRLNSNYFFYDGLYWVFLDDEWYSSEWYNGPWYRTAPEYVPVYILRIPVRYYRRPPPYFRDWSGNAPPRWGQHWGRDWEQHRRGWDRWDRRSAPAPAPLPAYQRQYRGKNYPRLEQQQALHDQRYRYQPRDALVREHVRPPMRTGAGPEARDRQPEPRKDAGKDARERDQRPAPARPPMQKSEPPAQHQAPPAPERRQEPPRRDAGKDMREHEQRPAPPPATPREPPPPPRAAPPREAPPPPRAAPPQQGGGEPHRGKGPEREHEKEDRGHDKK